MSELPLLFAFTAGLLATVNPCGFAMLPAYLSFFLGLDAGDAGDGGTAPRRSAGAAAGIALGVGGLTAAGFVVVFGGVGLLLALGIEWIVPAMPWTAIAVGVGVVGLGGWLLAGRTMPVPALRAGGGAGARGAFAFGVSYALASLSCTLPVLLTVIAAAFAQPTLGARFAVVGAYLAGMTGLLLAVTVALGVGKASLVRRLRALTPMLQRLAGGVLVLAGLWVIAYWAVILATGLPAEEVALVDRSAAVITDALARRPLTAGGLALVVVAAGALLAWREWSAARAVRDRERCEGVCARARRTARDAAEREDQPSRSER